MYPNAWVETTEAINEKVPAKTKGEVIQVLPDGRLRVDFAGIEAICEGSQVKECRTPKAVHAGFGPPGRAY